MIAVVEHDMIRIHVLGVLLDTRGFEELTRDLSDEVRPIGDVDLAASAVGEVTLVESEDMVMLMQERVNWWVLMCD